LVKNQDKEFAEKGRIMTSLWLWNFILVFINLSDIWRIWSSIWDKILYMSEKPK